MALIPSTYKPEAQPDWNTATDWTVCFVHKKTLKMEFVRVEADNEIWAWKSAENVLIQAGLNMADHYLDAISPTPFN